MEDIGLEEKLARVQKLLDATSNDFSRICKELTDCEKERDQLRKENEDLKADLATVTAITKSASASRSRMKATATRIAIERNQLRAELASAKELVRWRKDKKEPMPNHQLGYWLHNKADFLVFETGDNIYWLPIPPVEE